MTPLVSCLSWVWMSGLFWQGSMPSVTHFAVQGILPPSQITHTSPPVFAFIKTFG